MNEIKKAPQTTATVSEEMTNSKKTINEQRVEAGLTPLDDPKANILMQSNKVG